MTLLSIRGLHTHFVTRDRLDQVRIARVLNGVILRSARGRILGLVGESGAGKSLTVTSILGLLRPPARVVAGQALFQGHDLLACRTGEMMPVCAAGISASSCNRRRPRWTRSPGSASNSCASNARMAPSAARRRNERAEAMLAAVGIPDPRAAACAPGRMNSPAAWRSVR